MEEIKAEDPKLWDACPDIKEQMAKIPLPEILNRALLKDFVVPPFTILDTRQGYWQTRRRCWLSLNIKSEVGRGDNVLFDKTGQDALNLLKGGTEFHGTSIFDPVLCEIVYRWFCPKSGRVLDPFAGGSVRGIVAAALGYGYTGVELRPEQVAANKEQAKEVGVKPKWVVGDAANIKELVPGKYDLIFTCPPYYDLEVYSDLPGELSAIPTYNQFLQAYWDMIGKALSLLKNNRFACFVVGDIRDKKGFYRNLIGDTIEAFLAQGVGLYNEAIIVTAIGTLPLRVRRQFNAGRKLGKTHQNILIFYKGDPKKIKTEFGNLKGI